MELSARLVPTTPTVLEEMELVWTAQPVPPARAPTEHVQPVPLGMASTDLSVASAQPDSTQTLRHISAKTAALDAKPVPKMVPAPSV